MTNDNNIKLSVPGEWAAEKVLTPVLGEIGKDIQSLYALSKVSAKKIVMAAYRKITDKKDGKQANQRVARDVFWNGSFSDESICAEYFGGILASSRSKDGKNDNGIHYIDIIKSLSSKQLQLHYMIYNSFNKIFIKGKKSKLNVGMEPEITKEEVWFSSMELVRDLELKIDTDLIVLYKQGLLSMYKISYYKMSGGGSFGYTTVKPTTFGVLLYAIAHNKFKGWLLFNTQDFGDFKDIKLPKFYAQSINDLLMTMGIKEKKQAHGK